MKALCARVADLLLEESNVHLVPAPVTVCGDIHGQFWDVLEIFRQGGEAPDTSYIFMVSAEQGRGEAVVRVEEQVVVEGGSALCLSNVAG